MAAKDGGPAMPNPGMYFVRNNEPVVINEPVAGMSLRDWFAGQALVAALGLSENESVASAVIAEQAFELADAMLAERAKATEPANWSPQQIIDHAG